MAEPPPAPQGAPPQGSPPQGSGKGSRCVLIGCAAGLGLCVILAVIGHVRNALKSPEEKAAEQKAAEDAQAARKQKGLDMARELSRKLAAIARQLPAPNALEEKPAPELKGKVVQMTPADAGFFAQFGDEGYVAAKDSPYAWPRSSHLEQARTVLKKVAEKQDFFVAEVENVVGEIEKRPYVGVFYPVDLRQPALSDDGKTFSRGSFDGWIVLVALETGKPLRQARFTAASSERVEDKYVKVAGVKIGADMKKALQDDFNQNVIAQALNAILR